MGAASEVWLLPVYKKLGVERIFRRLVAPRKE